MRQNTTATRSLEISSVCLPSSSFSSSSIVRSSRLPSAALFSLVGCTVCVSVYDMRSRYFFMVGFPYLYVLRDAFYSPGKCESRIRHYVRD